MSNVFHILTRKPLDAEVGSAPLPGECLPCYLDRTLEDLPCSGTFTWTEHYRSVRAKRASALSSRLRQQGAECDCEVVMHVWAINPGLWVPAPGGAYEAPESMPPCAGVRPNSTQACDHWTTAKDVAL